jgi:hypothetical protein
MWSKFGTFPETLACDVGVEVIAAVAVAVAGFVGVRVAGWAAVGLTVGSVRDAPVPRFADAQP